MFRNTRVFTSFSTDDVQKAKAFYGQTLGLDVDEGKEGLDLRLAGGTRVFIYPKSNHAPATFTVLNFMVDDVEQTAEALVKKGVRFEIYDGPIVKTDARGISRGNGPVGAWFKDPAGNILSIMQISPDAARG